MSIVGTIWALYYDWGSMGTYGRTSIGFNADNTFVDGGGFGGRWVQMPGMLMFQYDLPDVLKFKTTYCGTLADKSVTGIATNFSDPSGGSFFMIEATVFSASVAERAHPVADASGKRHHPRG
jgi:hypothetical protein